MIVIGDIAGNFKTLQALLAQMPSRPIISLGDMIDRGPHSQEVLNFIRSHGQAVMGNHEHLLLDYYHQKTNPQHIPYYPSTAWLSNGGVATLENFARNKHLDPFSKIDQLIDMDYINYLQALPLFLDLGKFFLSHAPKRPGLKLQQAHDLGSGFLSYPHQIELKSEGSLFWFRGDPEPWPGKIQIYGHNAYPEVLYHTAQNPQGVIKDDLDKSPIFALGIDTSYGKMLTAVLLPELTIFQQEYID